MNLLKKFPAWKKKYLPNRLKIRMEWKKTSNEQKQCKLKETYIICQGKKHKVKFIEIDENRESFICTFLSYSKEEVDFKENDRIYLSASLLNRNIKSHFHSSKLGIVLETEGIIYSNNADSFSYQRDEKYKRIAYLVNFVSTNILYDLSKEHYKTKHKSHEKFKKNFIILIDSLYSSLYSVRYKKKLEQKEAKKENKETKELDEKIDRFKKYMKKLDQIKQTIDSKKQLKKEDVVEILESIKEIIEKSKDIEDLNNNSEEFMKKPFNMKHLFKMSCNNDFENEVKNFMRTIGKIPPDLDTIKSESIPNYFFYLNYCKKEKLINQQKEEIMNKINKNILMFRRHSDCSFIQCLVPTFLSPNELTENIGKKNGFNTYNEVLIYVPKTKQIGFIFDGNLSDLQQENTNQVRLAIEAASQNNMFFVLLKSNSSDPSHSGQTSSTT